MSDLHFEIPEDFEEEDYEDILFDRHNAVPIPIDMHPIKVDTTPTSNPLSDEREDNC